MKPLCIGITGFIGSGKTTVTNLLSELTGFYPVYLDKLGHQAYTEEEIRKRVSQHFHLEEENYSVESIRSAIREIVFRSENEKKWLENVLWPYIIHETKKSITEYRKCIIEGIILYPSGLDQLCRCVLNVQTKKSLLRERLTNRGYSPETISLILSSQQNMTKPLESKRIPQILVRNEGTKDEMKDVLTLLWEKKLRVFFEEEGRAKTKR